MGKRQQPKSPVFALCALLFALCVSAAAQQPKNVPRLGFLSPGDADSESTRIQAIRLSLRKLGYAEGQNIAFEYRYSEGKLDQLPALAAELVRLNVQIIVAGGGGRATRSAKEATKAIPIVMARIAILSAMGLWPALPNRGEM